MSEKEKKPSDVPKKDEAGAGSSQGQESVQSKLTASLKKENEALEEASKKQDDTIASLAKNIKELKDKNDK